MTNSRDSELAAKITAAVKAVDAAIAVATDRKTFEKLQADAAARQKKSRDKKKALPKPEPRPQPKQPRPDDPAPAPVRDVTDRPASERDAIGDKGDDTETSAAKRKLEYATPEEKAAAWSAANLDEFKYACHQFLPRLNETDLKKARVFFMERHWTKQKAA